MPTQKILEIRSADFNDPQIRHLVEAHHAYGAAHYPAESNHEMGIEELAADNMQLFTAWLDDKCVGMAGYKDLGQGRAELKSMHVLESGRGHGVASKLMTHILELARQQKMSEILLETGSRDASAAARAMYEKVGFVYCPPFGTYQEDPESVFMRLAL
ncbi:GNAT family N-acetyltransferase [Maritalea mediterranea]|uniref:GNAT family N-acetyltransferase n=1 Tax=Maritalea mediterranea TaxID=2909667 RepID=A0ABS9E6Y9_9HYPH|nr:GNAT family N-acetyltransferase [Maritalea mediterranea]MCF4097216.1 GNAT family N-acetyltransferase [Maritalea mediterranea]